MESTSEGGSEVRHLQELVDRTPDVLWMFSADWDDLLFVNDAYETVWGRPTEELAADPVSFLEGVHPDDREEVLAAVESVTAGSSVDVEYRVNESEDYGRWVRSRAEPIFEDDTVVRDAGFTRDVTDHKERETELERQNERLDAFASVVSHDLRNPLNVARGNLEMAREECDSDHLDAVEKAHDRMETLVEDLLVLAREGNRVEDAVPVSLADLARDCWGTVATGNATLTVTGDLRVPADPARLRQLFENLFRNAVEHAEREADDPVAVTVGPLEDATGFYVADDGPGLPADVREQMTDADAAGIGLEIVQDVVGAHGWTIETAESESGGARFDVSTAVSD